MELDSASAYGPGRRSHSGSSFDDEAPPTEPGSEFERTPPQDIAAEQCALGGMLLSKDAVADVVEILNTEDFYKPAHAIVFDAICDKYARGEPADAITLAAALNDTGDLTRIGGAPYLHTLIASVPTAANAAYYARIVSERAVLRRLIEAGTRVVQLGYGSAAGSGRDIDDLVDMAQQAVYDVTERRVSEDFAVLGGLLQPTLDEIEALSESAGVMTGVPTGFTDLDRLLNGLQSGQLIIVAGRPGAGKSTAAMDFLRHAALHHQQAAAIFSLEMSKIEIVMRLLSAETRVPLHILRSGSLSDDDWTRLARRMGEISEAPLFVDDTPSMTLMEIRAKARRLKQRHNLKLIVVDYLQLMSSPKRTESRQQEVSEISRGMKLLAKEVECPVIAVAQLNRGPEQRTDKRPQLSDLRESGCVTADTRLLRADDNSEISIGELMNGAKDIPVWAMDERLRIVPQILTHAFASGRKATFQVTLASGKTVNATANHPFLTKDGWIPLAGLTPGTNVATPRRIPEPITTITQPDTTIRQIAKQLGDGSHHEIPPHLFALPDKQLTQFLTYLWEADGHIDIDDATEHGRIRYRAANTRIAYDMMRLLQRLGIAARTNETPCTTDISGRDNQLRFLREIDITGDNATAAIRLRSKLSTTTTQSEAVPAHVWQHIRLALTQTSNKKTPTRTADQPLSNVATILAEENLELLATNDVLWEPIKTIEPLGEQDVYDATVLKEHNFIANSMCLHNSLEQDADVVILLHREDYYDKESPRAGEADFIVAKHRNGATDTITVAAQLHLSRFVDMAV